MPSTDPLVDRLDRRFGLSGTFIADSVGPPLNLAHTVIPVSTAVQGAFVSTSTGVIFLSTSVIAASSAFETASTIGIGLLQSSGAAAARALIGAAESTAQATFEHGAVLMYRTTSTGSTSMWIVKDPYNNLIDLTGTLTQGLQEAIDWASTRGYSLHVRGGSVGATGVDLATIHCTTGIRFPPMQGKRVVFDWTTVNFSSAVTGYGVTIDSAMMVNFEFNGQIVYAGAAAALRFNPQTAVPLDNVKSIVDSRFYVQTIACSTVASTLALGVHFVHSTAPIHHNFFDFTEINGGGAAGGSVGQTGIVVNDSTSGFQHNSIRARHIHGWNNIGFQLGTQADNAAHIHGNFIEATVKADSAMNTGFHIWGRRNKLDVSVIGPDCQVGVNLDTSAQHNIVNLIDNDAVTAISDASTGNNLVSHRGLRGLASYSVGNVPAASVLPGAMVYITNDATGAVPAFSDGTNWRRVTDRGVVST